MEGLRRAVGNRMRNRGETFGEHGGGVRREATVRAMKTI